MIPRIVKRGDSYSLCYRYTDHADKTHIKLEPCTSLDDAHFRLEEVMQQQEKRNLRHHKERGSNAMPSLRFQTTRATISLSQLIWDNQPTPCGQKGCTSMEYTPASAGNPPQTYRVEDVASILGISRKSAYNLTREGYFRVVRIGSTIRISKKSFDDWLNNQTSEV